MINFLHLPSFTLRIPNSGSCDVQSRPRHFIRNFLAVLGCLVGVASADDFGDFTYTDEGTTITITGYSKTVVGPVVIPETINGKDVTKIGTEAFFDRPGVTSVSVPSKVTMISPQAFAYCTSMESISMPAGVTSVGFGAFAICTGLTSFQIPAGLTVIPRAMMFGCSSLSQITIPSTVSAIDTTAFQNCGALTSLTISEGVTSIGENAFDTCSKLTGVLIPGSVLTIGAEAFINCSSLTSISVAGANPNFSSLNGVLFNKSQDTLIAFPPGLSGGYMVPAGVTTIGSKAFFTCEKLVGVTLPNGLSTVQTEAFSTCSALLYANFMGSAPTTIDSNEFSLTPEGFTAYYLDSFAEDFTEYPWTDFKNPPVNMGANDTPAKGWLLSEGLPANQSLTSDLNGDGVNLLMAFALDMDPYLHNVLPQAELGTDQMSLTFYANNPAINYVVKTSPDLMTWTTAGVAISGTPEARTATVAFTGLNIFMRLEVSE